MTRLSKKTAACLPILLIALCVPIAVAAGCDDGGDNGSEDAAVEDTAEEGTADLTFDPSPDVEDVEEDVVDGSPDMDDAADTTESPDITSDGLVRGRVQLPFDLTVEGRGESGIGAISFAGSVGLVDVGAELPALAYIMTDWEAYGYTLYHVLAPANRSLNVMYLYCGNISEDSFDYVWHESYDTAMYYERGRGSCASVERFLEADVEIFDLSAMPRPEELVTGFAVTGSQVNITGAGGTLTVNDRTMNAYAFEAVDCTAECTADPADGWWELHMAMEEPASDDHCFGILYLYLNNPTLIQFAYGFCLRSLTPMVDEAMRAGWTAPEGGGGGSRQHAAAPRHPETGTILRPDPLQHSQGDKQ